MSAPISSFWPRPRLSDGAPAPTPTRASFLRLPPPPRFSATTPSPFPGRPPLDCWRLRLHSESGTVLCKSSRWKKLDSPIETALFTLVPFWGQNAQISCFHLSNKRRYSAQNNRQRVLFNTSTSSFNRLVSGNNFGSTQGTDESFDDLLKKHGKVVFRRNDRKSLTQEAYDDAESLSLAVSLAKVASEVKGADIRVLFVKPLVYWTRFFIIATAFSRPQIDAMGSKIRDMAEKKFQKFATGDTKPNSWTLLDFGDVVVHIFLPPQREYYNLEEFYGNATPIELSFESQSSSFRN